MILNIVGSIDGQDDIGFKQKKTTIFTLFWKLWKEKNYGFPPDQEKQT